MGKIKRVLLVLILTLFFVKPVAADNIAGRSAVMISSNIKSKDVSLSNADFFIKKRAIKKVLEKYDSPMIDSIDTFIASCNKYDLDCYLLPSIATLESTLGRFVWPDSYNAFGWGGGYIMFDNWGEGIDTVANGLRKNYMNKGALSIEQIGPIYSESPTWALRVQLIKKQFEKEEKNQLYLNDLSVKL